MKNRAVIVFLIGVVVVVSSAGLCFGKAAYMGPAGSFTNEATSEFFGPKEELVPLVGYLKVFEAYSNNSVENMIIAVSSDYLLGGIGRHLDEIIKLAQLGKITMIGERLHACYYSVMAKPGAKLEGIKTLASHPAVIGTNGEFVPWIQKNMPSVQLRETASTGEAAKIVGEGTALDIAAVGPAIGAKLYGLNILVPNIAVGPPPKNNVTLTRFMAFGRKMPDPTGKDKTSLLIKSEKGVLNNFFRGMVKHNIMVVDIYERPTNEVLGNDFYSTNYYFIDVEGHSKQAPLKDFLAEFPNVKVLGSYPRAY